MKMFKAFSILIILSFSLISCTSYKKGPSFSAKQKTAFNGNCSVNEVVVKHVSGIENEPDWIVETSCNSFIKKYILLSSGKWAVYE